VWELWDARLVSYQIAFFAWTLIATR